MNEGTIRIGIVTAVNADSMKVRVQFPDVDIISDWLSVMRHNPTVDIDETDGHTHSVVLEPWMPSIGAAVICVYMPGFNADGYVLGGIA